MYLQALATAVPDQSFTQAECWELARNSTVRERLNRRSLLTLQAVLRSQSGVERRAFAVQNVDKIFDLSADELNLAFQREAPALAGRALTNALNELGARPEEIDALLICTCTGYLCPGVTSYVAEQLGLRTDAFLQDLVGLGCGAAIPTLRAADAILARNPNALVACVAVEICSAAFYLDDDAGVLVSACLFGDGAAASLWRSTPREERPLRCHTFNTLHQPANRDRIRFEQRNGKLRNLLHSSVPELAAAAVAELLNAEKSRADQKPIKHIISHPGGRDVLDAIERLIPHRLDVSREVLHDHGNMSSPSVLFALERMLRDSTPDAEKDWWLVSFGAGFSAHACRFGI